MKKFKTLSFIVAAASLLIGAGPLRSVCAGTYFDVASIVMVSSTTAQPSTLLAPGNQAEADVRILCTQLNQVGETILIRSSSTGFSTSLTTGTARIPCLPNTVQQLDFFIDDYRGPLYAITTSTYPIPVSIWRKK